MIVLAHLILVILKLVATHPLFLAMITMLVPMTIVTLDLDVPTPQ
jgi:hypothetical protein